MDLHVPFTFRNRLYTCTIYIDNSEDPCYVFVDLLDQELINEFGGDIAIKTDFELCLPMQDDYPSLMLLREAIFKAIKEMPAFIDNRVLFPV